MLGFLEGGKEFHVVTHSRCKGFEDSKVYRRSRELVPRVYRVTQHAPFSTDYALKDQIRRACISISSNIAEGSERGSTTEFIQFLYISKGSSAEVRSHLNHAFDLHYIDTPLYNELTSECRYISGMLANLITYLKNSPYRGYKYK